MKNRKEAKKLIEWISLNGISFLDKFSEKYYNENLFNSSIEIRQFEEPDILFFIDGNIIGIEHFEFNSSIDYSNGGSSMKSQQGKFNKNRLTNRIEKEEKQISSVDVLQQEYKSESTLEYYINNLVTYTEKHLVNLDTYKKNILSKIGRESSSFGFLIEFGLDFKATIRNKEIDDDIHHLNPFMIESLCKFFKEHQEVEHIFYKDGGMENTNVYYVKNTDEIVERFSEIRIDEKKEWLLNIDYLEIAIDVIGYDDKLNK